ncbi:hypothetical protein HYV82_03920 [Candidatus Woesearchaeota archaeon]|nr:hypothetical protein [Candidatus Woesearchaeota archaeon]
MNYAASASVSVSNGGHNGMHGQPQYYLVPLNGGLSPLGANGDNPYRIGAVVVSAGSPEAARNMLVVGIGAGSRRFNAFLLHGSGCLAYELRSALIGVPEGLPQNLHEYVAGRNGSRHMPVMAVGSGVPPSVCLVGSLEDITARLNAGWLYL